MAAWIFQVNPTRFDIDADLRTSEEMWRCVRGPAKGSAIQPGDRVFLWRADGKRKGTGGVVAIGKALTAPELVGERSISGIEEWGEKPVEEAPTLKVQIVLDEVRLSAEEGMVLRSELKMHPELCDLQVLRMPQGTTYTVSPEHERLLLDRWRTEVRDRTEVSVAFEFSTV